MKRPSSSSFELWEQLEDMSDAMEEISLSEAATEPRPSCIPRLFDSQSSETRKHFKVKKWYNVYTGNTPGCYTTWADASARTQEIPGARHEAFKKYEDALHAWRQNCLAVHVHDQGFVDGTVLKGLAPVLEGTSPTSPEPPRACTPPPYQSTFRYASDGKYFTPPSSPATGPSQASSTQSLSKRRVGQAMFGPGSPARLPERHSQVNPVRYWAISVNGQKTIATTVDHADGIVEEAQLRGVDAVIKQVASVREAEEWFALLETATDESQHGD
ncbi:hypothetical protein D9758_010796 [Tetrapyrgos nigripes]|uniref:Ribonuclease H1 N-terminal domain-containing protein n=1 Tax=Tetrapyrgos nigripes TaxID=182062 RepID=A0A8H5D0V5_9AGAR|nr:hypothetical protein D9758_013534 [Tetrapyrgos nigripes]KAF5354392.1 hypothetical protein D9758_010796 [Tetrapyrgos nigripes]